MSETLEQADALRLSGRVAEAERAYRAAIAVNDRPGAAHYGLGLILKSAQRPQEAMKAFLLASRDPAAPMEAYIEAGALAAAAGRPDIAMDWVRQAAARYTARHEPYYYLGCMQANDGHHDEAIRSLRRAQQIKSPDAEISRALILSLRKTRRFAEALQEADAWARTAPDDPAAFATLAHIHLEQNRPEEALAGAETAAKLSPDSPDAAILTGRVLALLGRTSEAVAELERARARAPDRADIYLHLGNLLKIDGRLPEARVALQRALALDPSNAQAFFELSEIVRFQPGDRLVAQMEQLVRNADSEPKPASSLVHFALGKAYDDIGDPDAAFRHAVAANVQELAQSRYDEKAALDALKRIAEIVTPEFLASLKGAGNPSALPVFIVGMPRSGSTLVEQILASHPDVAALGERLYLRQSIEAATPGKSFPENLAAIGPQEAAEIAALYLARVGPNAHGKKRATDKLLANGLIAGLIHAVFPNARIVHCLRDPADTCLSCYMKSFGQRVPYSADLMTLARYYRAQTELMDHWRAILPDGAMLDVRYEDVVGDIEGQARRLIAYCGLEWNDACIAFHQTRRPVNTASVAQVREPLYTSSVGRWRGYAAHLAPMLAYLNEAAP